MITPAGRQGRRGRAAWRRTAIRPRWSRFWLPLGAWGLAAVAGLGLFGPAALIAIAALAAAAALWWVESRFGMGPILAILVLAGVDSLPGPSLEASVLNSVTYEDIFVVVLAALLLRENARTEFSYLRHTIPGRLITAWALCFALWYLYTIIHTVFTTPVPLVHTLTFSRQFIYTPLLLPLLIGPLQRKDLRDPFLVVIGYALVVTCLARIAAVVGHTSLSFLVHGQAPGTTDGLARVRGAQTSLPFAALPFGYGLVLYGRGFRQRALGSAMAISGLIAIALSLTRGMYLGMAIGLSAATVLALLAMDSRARLARKRLVRASIAMLGVTIATAAIVPSHFQQNTLESVSTRASSLVSVLTNDQEYVDSSTETRHVELYDLEYALRGHWVAGLGELDPTYDYVSTVLNGNIDNIDISLFGSIALIGIIGVGIYVLPLIGVTLALLRDRVTVRTQQDHDWLAFGGLAWCIGVMVVSPELGIIWAYQEVVGSATIIALLVGLFSTSRPTSTDRLGMVTGPDPRSADRA